jgi:hypothetical protein
MRAGVGMRHEEGREGGMWDVVVIRKSLVSPSEGLGDCNGEVREPSVLVFGGSKFRLRAYRDTRRESHIPHNRGPHGNLPPKKV